MELQDHQTRVLEAIERRGAGCSTWRIWTATFCAPVGRRPRRHFGYDFGDRYREIKREKLVVSIN